MMDNTAWLGDDGGHEFFTTWRQRRSGLRRDWRERGCGHLQRRGMGAWLDQDLRGTARRLRRGRWRLEGRRHARLSRWAFHRAAWRRGEGEEDPLAPFRPVGWLGCPRLGDR